MADNQLPVSAPVTIGSAGKTSDVASVSVMRIICTKTGMGGTGFLHQSGHVITAAHVVADCTKTDLRLVLANGAQIGVSNVILDVPHDLAIVTPDTQISQPALPISDATEILVGSKVTTWGFPSGYTNNPPLLTVGYLAGLDRIPLQNGWQSSPRWVVNAAFNGGNSGGPVLNAEDGSVIGVVSSKLAPVPQYIESALDALLAQQSGFVYTRTLSDGTQENISEGKIVGEILKYLRSQTQLVLGHAVTSQDLRVFLKSNHIEP